MSRHSLDGIREKTQFNGETAVEAHKKAVESHYRKKKEREIQEIVALDFKKMLIPEYNERAPEIVEAIINSLSDNPNPKLLELLLKIINQMPSEEIKIKAGIEVEQSIDNIKKLIGYAKDT